MATERPEQAWREAELHRRISYLEGIALPHARKQENANGFQRGWHAALNRIREGDQYDDLRSLVPEPGATVEVPVCVAEQQLAAAESRIRELEEALTVDDLAQIAEGIEHFIMGGDPAVDAVWQSYVDGLDVLRTALSKGRQA